MSISHHISIFFTKAATIATVQSFIANLIRIHVFFMQDLQNHGLLLCTSFDLLGKKGFLKNFKPSNMI